MNIIIFRNEQETQLYLLLFTKTENLVAVVKYFRQKLLQIELTKTWTIQTNVAKTKKYKLESQQTRE